MVGRQKWQDMVLIICMMIILSMIIGGCFKRAPEEAVGSSAPPEARTLTLTAQPITTIAGTTLTSVTVELQDQYNTIITGTAVSITTTDNSIVLNGTLSRTTDSSGIATFNDLMITKTGTYTLNASVGAINANSTAFGITAAVANNLVFVQQPTTTTAGAAFSPVVTIRILDAYNNVAITATNPVSITVSSGTLGGTTLNVTAVAGFATFTGVTVDTTVATNLTLTATSAGIISATSTSFNITAGALNNYLVVAANSSVVTGSEQTATVTARDVYGNTINTASNTITMTINVVTATPTVTFYTDGTYGTIKSAPVVYTLGSGVATVWYKAVHDGAPPDAFTIRATDAAAKTGTSGPVEVTD
jgi:hypothetical protein